jgi:hypothetical protein
MPAPLIAAAAAAAVPKLLEVGMDLIDRLFPDPEQADKHKLELLKLAREGQLAELEAMVKLGEGQLRINEAEAANPRLWVSGWRPAAGWAGVAGLVYATIVTPLLGWLSALNGWGAPPPIDGELLWLVLGTLLGVGTLRSFDKSRGVAS